MQMHFFILLCLIPSALISTVENKKPKSHPNKFIATNEWKTIEEGQTVPSGLHYRLNLETGKKEAKILDDKDDSKHVQIVKETIPVAEQDQLSNAFMALELEEQKAHVDQKAIESLLLELQDLCGEAEIAEEFYSRNGVDKIISKHLNSSDDSIKSASLALFATVIEHRPIVKKHVVETGGIMTLLKLFSLEKHPVVKRGALKALGVTIINFPEARNKFFELGGLQVFTESFNSQPLKEKVKMVTLLYDLLSERREDLDNALYNLGWCPYFNELFKEVVMVNIQDFDSIEKCLLAMDAMATKCQSFYKSDFSLELNRQFALLSELDEDHYFKNLSTLVGRLFEGSRNEL